MKPTISSLVEQTSFYGADRIKVLEQGDYTVLLVADGAGGMSGAKEASEYIVNAFESVISKYTVVPDVDDLELIVRNLDGYVLREKDTGCTTLVAVFVTADQIYGVSVGDSRCWQYTDLYQLELTAHQYRQPLLGTGESIPVAFGPFEANGTLLLGSDGLFDYLRQPIIDGIMKEQTDIEEIPKQLLAIIKKANTKLVDDISIMVCRLS